jgi:hypothetical protein
MQYYSKVSRDIIRRKIKSSDDGAKNDTKNDQETRESSISSRLMLSRGTCNRPALTQTEKNIIIPLRDSDDGVRGKSGKGSGNETTMTP